jgi:hypothetical protein
VVGAEGEQGSKSNDLSHGGHGPADRQDKNLADKADGQEHKHEIDEQREATSPQTGRLTVRNLR